MHCLFVPPSPPIYVSLGHAIMSTSASQFLRCLSLCCLSHPHPLHISSHARTILSSFSLREFSTVLIFFYFSPINLKVQMVALVFSQLFQLLSIRILLYLMAQVFNTSTWEIVAGGFPWVWDQLWLHSELQLKTTVWGLILQYGKKRQGKKETVEENKKRWMNEWISAHGKSIHH